MTRRVWFTFCVDYAGNQLYVGDDPTAVGTRVEATTFAKAFDAVKSGAVDPFGTILRGLGFAHFADQAVFAIGLDLVFENNTFVWNGLHGAKVYGRDLLVRGNTLSCNGLVGLSVDNTPGGALFENNTISHNNVESFSTGYAAAGIKIIHSVGFTIRNNVFERNYCNALWLDVSCIRAKLVHNVSRHNRSSSIIVELSHDTIVAFNRCHNNYIGVSVWDSSASRVVNNTLSRNTHALFVRDSPRFNDPNDAFPYPGEGAEEAAAGALWVTRDTVVKNNLLSNGRSPNQPLVDASNCPPRWTGEATLAMVSAWNHNGYYRTNANSPARLVQWSLGPGASQCEVLYSTLATFRSATGLEPSGLAIDNVAINPFFFEETNEDFRLKPGSPGAFRGEALPADIAQAVGVPAGPQHLGALGEAIASAPLYLLDYGNAYFFLTASQAEHDYLVGVGWTSRGAPGRAYANTAPDLVALYRLYAPYNGDHFYTTNAAERDAAVSSGYVYKGVAGFVLAQGGLGRIALLRAYNPSTGQHRFTGDQSEYNALPIPWIKEGIAGYLGVNPS